MMAKLALLAVVAAALLAPPAAAAAKPKALYSVKAVFMGGRRAGALTPAKFEQPALFASVTIMKDEKVYSAFLTPAKRFVVKSGLFKKKALEEQLISAQLVGMCERAKICRASFAPVKAVSLKDQFIFSLGSAPEMVSSTGVGLGPLPAGTLTIGSANTELVWRDVEVDPCWALDCSDPLAGAQLNSSIAEWQVASGADGGVLMPDGKLYVRQPGLATFDLHVDSKIPGVVFGHAMATRINNYLKANKPRAQLVAMGLRKNGAPKLSTAAAFDVQLLSCGYDYAAEALVFATTYAAPTSSRPAAAPGVEEGSAVAVAAATSSNAIMYPFVGGGYYSLVGFPLFQGEGVDAGFTSGWIYDATVLSSSTNVNPQNVSVCSGGFEGTQFASTRDVQSKSGASLSINVYNSLFGLNSDFQNSNSYFETQGYVSWSYNQICQVMTVGLTFDVCDAQLSTNFVNGVKTLAGELGKTDNLYTNLAQSFLPTFGDYIVTETSLGGFVWSGYASSVQNLTTMKSKGFDFDVSSGFAACQAQAGTGANNTAASLMSEYGVQGTYTISPGYPPIPFNEGGGSINNSAWYNALFTQLTPGDLTAITSQTAQITTVLQCPSGSAVAAQMANASITNDQLGQLVTVIQDYIENCGSPGSTCPVSEPFSYCSPGYYATASAGSATPDCQPCFGGTPSGGDGCNPFTTAYCTGPGVCTCDCGFSGSTCEDVCWWGTCSSEPKGTSCEVNPADTQCQPGAPYAEPVKSDGNCDCKCCENSVYKDDECASGNSCSASDISLPSAPYLEACNPGGCSMSNEWVLTCTNCTGLAAGANVTLNTCGCGVPSSIQFCTSGSFSYLACGACNL